LGHESFPLLIACYCSLERTDSHLLLSSSLCRVAYAVIVLLLARDSFGDFLCLDFSFVYLVQSYVSTSSSGRMAANSGLDSAYNGMTAHAGGVTGLWRVTAALHFCDAPLLLLTGIYIDIHIDIYRQSQPRTHHTSNALHHPAHSVPFHAHTDQRRGPLTLYR
jgi:hypothetical protein